MNSLPPRLQFDQPTCSLYTCKFEDLRWEISPRAFAKKRSGARQPCCRLSQQLALLYISRVLIGILAP